MSEETPIVWCGSASVLCILDEQLTGVFLLVSLNLPSILDYEANLIFKELANDFVLAARSWIPFRSMNPDCYRIPFDAVLRRYVEWDERGLDGEDVDFALFWQELLDEHRPKPAYRRNWDDQWEDLTSEQIHASMSGKNRHRSPKLFPPEEQDLAPKYATPDEVQAALSRGREVLAKHHAAVDPLVQRVRDLAEQRRWQKDAEIEGYRRRQHARQEREDKAIEDFQKWDRPDGSRLM